MANLIRRFERLAAPAIPYGCGQSISSVFRVSDPFDVLRLECELRGDGHFRVGAFGTPVPRSASSTQAGTSVVDATFALSGGLGRSVQDVRTVFVNRRVHSAAWNRLKSPCGCWLTPPASAKPCFTSARPWMTWRSSFPRSRDPLINARGKHGA